MMQDAVETPLIGFTLLNTVSWYYLNNLLVGRQVVYKRPGRSVTPRYGFIHHIFPTSSGNVLPFCYFWKENDLTQLDETPESVPISMLSVYKSVADRYVAEALEKIEGENNPDA